MRRFLVWALLLMIAGYTFLDYWEYSRVEHADPVSWERLAAGHGIAPAQYRIGVYYTAHAVAKMTHLHLRHVFAIADAGCTLASLAALFFLLTRSPIFVAAQEADRWAMVLFGLLLTQVYLVWTFWFQQPETMPSLAILVALALLFSGALKIPPAMRLVTILLLALLGAMVRADAVVAFFAGTLLAALAGAHVRLPWNRGVWMSASLAGLLLAAGVEDLIARHMFPGAVREVALVQILYNVRSANGLLAPACTMVPWGLTVWLAFRSWNGLDGWVRGLVLGSLADCALFLTFGMSDEVRIFIPFMLVLMPLSAQLLLRWCISGERAGA